MTSPEREAPKTSTKRSTAFGRRQELHLRVFIDRPTRLLPYAKILLVTISFFLCWTCWVDYALEGSPFSLSKCDFSRLFHTEKSWHTYRFTEVFVSGRQDLPSDARAFSLTSFEESSFLLRLNKGLPFLQSAFWIWTTKRFWVMPRCILPLFSPSRPEGTPTAPENLPVSIRKLNHRWPKLGVATEMSSFPG